MSNGVVARAEIPHGFDLRAFDTIGSTNDEAESLARTGTPEGTVVWAREQSSGRGRLDRKWESPHGNLFMSLILRPRTAVTRAAEISFVAGLAVRDAIRACAPECESELRLKWPNDVLLNGAKIAGILLQSSSLSDGTVDWLVVGIGINLLHAPKVAAYRAAALAEFGVNVTPDLILPHLLQSFADWYHLWREQGFAPIRQAWLDAGHRADEALRVSGPAGPLSGQFAGLAEDGALLLRTPEGIRRIDAGDILQPVT